MGSVMDQDRPWENVVKPEGATLRERIETIQTDYNNTRRTVGQIINELERIESLISDKPDVQETSQHGWVAYNSGEREWRWSEYRETLVHELTDVIRPATHLEKYFFNKQGNRTWEHETPPLKDHDQDETQRKFELWFFRDLDDYQRKMLFNLFGMPTDEITTHGFQQTAFQHIMKCFETRLVVDDVLESACKAFSEGRAVYPDGEVDEHIVDWFKIDPQDAVDFGVLKEPKWDGISDIRGMEQEWYIAAVIKEPMRDALNAVVKKLKEKR